jgi:hypothetical protein
LLSRFGDREDLGLGGARNRFWPELDEQAVISILTLIEREYGLPSGILRPGDSLEKLFQPIETKNPLKWMMYQLRASDKKSEINYELGRRMARSTKTSNDAKITTVDDLVRSWCYHR